MDVDAGMVGAARREEAEREVQAEDGLGGEGEGVKVEKPGAGGLNEDEEGEGEGVEVERPGPGAAGGNMLGKDW